MAGGSRSSGSSDQLKKQRSSRLLLEDFVDGRRKSGSSNKGAVRNLHQELDLSKARNKALERLGLGIGTLVHTAVGHAVPVPLISDALGW